MYGVLYSSSFTFNRRGWRKVMVPGSQMKVSGETRQPIPVCASPPK
jgi:hypothetical protein